MKRRRSRRYPLLRETYLLDGADVAASTDKPEIALKLAFEEWPAL
jgi:hypothetical protein